MIILVVLENTWNYSLQLMDMYKEVCQLNVSLVHSYKYAVCMLIGQRRISIYLIAILCGAYVCILNIPFFGFHVIKIAINNITNLLQPKYMSIYWKSHVSCISLKEKRTSIYFTCCFPDSHQTSMKSTVYNVPKTTGMKGLLSSVFEIRPVRRTLL